MPKKALLCLFVFLLSIFLVFLTVQLKEIEVSKQSELEHISCGWPLPFIDQNQSWRNPPFPWKVRCGIFNLESPTEYNLTNLAIDTAFFYAILLLFPLISISIAKHKNTSK
jgi:hypothetical protein